MRTGEFTTCITFESYPRDRRTQPQAKNQVNTRKTGSLLVFGKKVKDGKNMFISRYISLFRSRSRSTFSRMMFITICITITFATSCVTHQPEQYLYEGESTTTNEGVRLAVPEDGIPDGMSVLMWAVFLNEEPSKIQQLIAMGADVHSRDDLRRTALMHAAYTSKSIDTIDILLDAGAEVNARSLENITPLIFAANVNRNPEIITRLIAAGADIDAQDDLGQTALLHAAGRSREPQIISLLISAGANVDVRNKGDLTALMIAARINEHPETIEALIEAGADVHAASSGGFTAWELIQMNEHLVDTDAYWLLHDLVNGETPN